MTYQEFVKKYDGKYTDFDGYYGAQCWDLAQRYITEVLNLPSSILSGCGLVSNMLYPPKRQELDKYFDEVPTNQMVQGDLCIWEYGHVAIFDHWDGNNCWYFSQNPNPCQIMVINSNGLHAFRKKGAPKPESKYIKYRGWVQDKKWTDWVGDGEWCGTMHESRRLEAIQIDPMDKDIDIYVSAQIQDDGWVDYGKITKDTIIGTQSQSKRLECLRIKVCKGNDILKEYNFQLHIQKYGDTCPTRCDGISTLGSVGQSLRVEAFRIFKK